MNGWIKLHRQFLEWEWFTDRNAMAVFIYCLLSANIDDKNWRGVNIERGSFITSLSKLAIDTGLTVKAIRIALDKLKKTSEIVVEGASQWTKITICKYDEYQLGDESEGHTNGTQKGKRGASEGQARGKRGATTKEYIRKKEREEGEEYIISAIGLHQNFIKTYTDWYIKKVGVSYRFSGGQDGKAVKEMIDYIQKAIKDKSGADANEGEIINAFQFILDNHGKWDKFNQKQLKLSQILSNLPNIMANIKGINGSGKIPIAERIADLNATIDRMAEYAPKR